jgi:hypothetical protein
VISRHLVTRRAPGRAIPSLVALLALSCGVQTPGPDVCVSGALSKGDLVAPGQYAFAVRVDTGGEGCTGTAIASRAVVVAAHCVTPGIGQATLRMGASAETCLGPPGACGPTGIDATVHTDVDLAILRLTDVAIPEPAEGFARLDASKDPSEFDSLGYGVGSYARAGVSCPSPYGQHLIHASFTIDWEDPDYFGAFVQPGHAAVCSGDSGGPALLEQNGAAYLLGVLSGSDSSPGDDCAPAGGFQLWVKTAHFVDWINGLIPSQ